MKRRELLLGGPLTVAALAVAATGCERKTDFEGERIAVPLALAPVADAHPWVMALLTDLGQTRPPGVDARLDERLGLEGQAVADPQMSAATREPLAVALDDYSARHERPTTLRPVWAIQHAADPAERRVRLFFIDSSEGLIFGKETRCALREAPSGEPQVVVILAGSQRRKLAKLTERFTGARMALILGDEALMTPIVREPLSGGELYVSGNPYQDPNKVAQALHARITGA